MGAFYSTGSSKFVQQPAGTHRLGFEQTEDSEGSEEVPTTSGRGGGK
jgi:hypothetical protein